MHRTAPVLAAALALAPLLAGPASARGPAGPGTLLATLMEGEGPLMRDAVPGDFVASKGRTPGCRSYSSRSGTAAGFRSSRLLTARAHATLREGPGKHYCKVGFVVGRALRLHVVGEEDGWFRVEVGGVTGWVANAELRREL